MFVPSMESTDARVDSELGFQPDEDWVPLLCGLAIEESRDELAEAALSKAAADLLKCRTSSAVARLWAVSEPERGAEWYLLQAIAALKRSNRDAALQLLHYTSRLGGGLAAVAQRLAWRCQQLCDGGQRGSRVCERNQLLAGCELLGRVSGQLPALLEGVENLQRRRFASALRCLSASRRNWKAYPDLAVLALTGELFALCHAGRWEDAAEHLYHHRELTDRLEVLPGGFREVSDQIRLRQHESLVCERALLNCYRHGAMLGRSAGFQRVIHDLRRAADSSAPVLITGETGTGKELATRYLHEHSALRGELVSINCAAVPEQLFESELFGSGRGAFTGAVEKEGLVARADGGTLLLDEFGALPATVQAKLLRVLENGEYYRVGDTRPRRALLRIVAATSEQKVLSGETFRQDLVYRVSGIRIELPPLRERPEDLELVLLDRLLGAGILPRRHPLWQVRTRLSEHSWPGNFRELDRFILRLLGASTAEVHAGLEDLQRRVSQSCPAALDYDQPLKSLLNSVEQRAIQHALLRSEGDKSRAARLLQVSPATLYARLRRKG